MKITFMALIAFTAVVILSGCASPGLSPVASGPAGSMASTGPNYDSDFNSNDSMPSNR